MSPVDWQPWHTAAFLDAQRRRRPVLLLLETEWAPACADVHAAVFSRPDVQQAVAETVVAIRVDADRRPDIADRYGLGQWPTVLLLTPEGIVITGGTQLDDGFASRLRLTQAAFAANDRAWRGVPARHVAADAIDDSTGSSAAHASDDDADALARIADRVWSARDPSSGGWFSDGRPCAASVLFALAHALFTRDDAWNAAAAATIERLGAPAGTRSGSSTRSAGGDGSAASARLEEHAAWVTTLARAVQVSGSAAWRSRLAEATDALAATFRRDDGTWRPWPCSTDIVLVDASAIACRALLAAADALDQPDRAREAIDSLEALAPGAYARGAGVSHVIEHGRTRGPMLLDDAMALGHALLDAQVWRTDPVYRDLAEELLRTSWVRLATPGGALTDRVAALAGGGCIGRLADPWPPLTGNAWAARLAVRLWPDDEQELQRARHWLRAVSPAAVEAGPFGACVGLAWHALEPSGRVAAAW